VTDDEGDRGKFYDKVAFNADEKYDIQFSGALVNERRLAEVFAGLELYRMQGFTVELKTETYQWEKHGNLCVEYRRSGKPSGISVTQADFWVHELRRDDQTLVYLMFPIARLKELAREAIRKKRVKLGCGDDGLSDVCFIRLRDILT